MDPSDKLIIQLEFHPTGWKRSVFVLANPALSQSPEQYRMARKKKSRAMRSPAPKIVSTLFTRCLDLILIGGATLLLRVRVPPETWTTRPGLAASLSPNS